LPLKGECLFDRERHSERENTSRGSRRGRSRLPAEQGARCGARSQDPGTMTRAEGRRLMTGPPRHPHMARLLRCRCTATCLRHGLWQRGPRKREVMVVQGYKIISPFLILNKNKGWRLVMVQK